MSSGTGPLSSQAHPRLSRDRWTTIEPLIDAALEVPAEGRHLFLDEACAGDPALREQLDRLLSQYDREDTLLDHPAAERFPSLLDHGGPARLPAVLGDRYRIEGEIGRGGMATVYLAHDIRHERKVAVKVLHPDLAAAIGAERFLAEIRTTAKLQHPHILPLHDSGETDGVLYYIMPHVEGGSLRKLMERERQLPIEDAVRIACEVASALDAAHREGVIHRDIKPENILLHNGSALVADFGIALAVSGETGSRLTATGITVGTPQYMSPEQASGERTIDSRSDSYSLAAVLFEMLAGEPPFTGPSTAAILAKLVALPAPSLRIVRAAIPEAVAAAVARALAREPADRHRTAGEFAEALQGTTSAQPAHADTASSTSGAEYQPRSLRRRLPRPIQLAGVAVAIAGAALASWAWRATHRAEVRTAVRFALTFPGVHVNGGGTDVAISPDGHLIAFVGLGIGGPQQLFVRPIDTLRTRPLPNTEEAEMPFFSPDGRWLGFWARGKLQKVSVDGGSVFTLADISGRFFGASWSPRKLIVASGENGLVTIPEAGGSTRQLTKPDLAKGEQHQRWPLVLADGRTVLYTSWGKGALTTAKIGVASLDNGQSTILDLPGMFPLGVMDELLVYASAPTPGASAALMAVPFDAGRRRVTGAPVQVVRDVVVLQEGQARAGMSRNGSLVYRSGDNLRQVVLADSRGVTRPLIPEPKIYHQLRFSPDGKRIAMVIRSPSGYDVWIYDVAGRTNTRLTTQDDGWGPEWTPDGRRVLFMSGSGGRTALWSRPADLSAPAALVLRLASADLRGGIISSDGRTLVYTTTENDVWYRSLAGDTTSKPVAPASVITAMPRLSPDGRWIAYVSNESGSGQVVVQPFPGPGARVQVSTDGGSEPVWAPDGHRLFFRHNQQFIAATVTTFPIFAVTSRVMLFEGNFFSSPYKPFDISRDGTQFLLVKVSEEPQTIFVHNWRDELRARMAARTAR